MFPYTFETIRVNERVEEVKVRIDTDSDLYMKSSLGRVNYGIGNAVALDVAQPADVTDKHLDLAVHQIYSGGLVEKVGKSLSPYETFTVSGKYATSWWRMQAFAIVSFFAVLAALITWSHIRSKRRTVQNKVKEEGTLRFLDVHHVLTGFASAVGVFAITWLVFYTVEGPLLDSVNYDMQGVFLIVGFILMVLTYLAVVFGPAIYMTVKYHGGWRRFGSVMGHEIFWFVVGLGVFISAVRV